MSYTLTELYNFHTGFSLKDLFGRKRMKKLIQGYREQIRKDTETIVTLQEYNKLITEVNCELNKKMLKPEKELRAEIEQLRKDLENAVSDRDAYAEYANNLEMRLDLKDVIKAQQSV